MKFPTEWKVIKFMFQTTKQVVMLFINFGTLSSSTHVDGRMAGCPGCPGRPNFGRLWRPAAVLMFLLQSLDWFSWEIYRKPCFLPSNIGLSCKFSHHPILWYNGFMNPNFNKNGLMTHRWPSRMTMAHVNEAVLGKGQKRIKMQYALASDHDNCDFTIVESLSGRGWEFNQQEVKRKRQKRGFRQKLWQWWKKGVGCCLKGHTTA